jgi:hypothetical protein
MDDDVVTMKVSITCYRIRRTLKDDVLGELVLPHYVKTDRTSYRLQFRVQLPELRTGLVFAATIGILENARQTSSLNCHVVLLAWTRQIYLLLVGCDRMQFLYPIPIYSTAYEPSAL